MRHIYDKKKLVINHNQTRHEQNNIEYSISINKNLMSLACLFKCSLFNIVVYGSLICILFMNIFGNRSIECVKASSYVKCQVV